MRAPQNPGASRLHPTTLNMAQAHHIDAHEVVIGRNVVIEPGVSISGIGGRAQRVVIGDNVYIGGDTKIRVPELVIGDYSRINNHALIYGYEPVHIGHNGWFGQNVVFNSTGALNIGNNCCVGAYSQLWTHFQFGDVMEGCRFNTVACLTLESDVWISGHCVVSPIIAEARSLALPGSVITSAMRSNRVYAGNPARDVTDRVGPQFEPVPVERKLKYLLDRLAEFQALNPVFADGEIGIRAGNDIAVSGCSMFDVASRTYTKTGIDAEFAFMAFLLPRAKFVPAAR